MKTIGTKNPKASLQTIGILNVKTAYWNLTPPELIEQTILRKQGFLTDTGAISILTGIFTGRSPKDKFVVKDDATSHTIDWGGFNNAFDPALYDPLFYKICDYFRHKDVFIRDNYVCADPQYRLNIRTVTEYPWSNHFADNMFLRPTKEEILIAVPDWTILCAPGFQADPKIDGVSNPNFTLVNFSKKQILIGGSGYTGEIKKGIFGVLNHELPVHSGVLPMHCSANVGKDGDTAIFFGLSGTGKTTLSADPDRQLVGDDEHGWSDTGVFNFEGGCYAKTINLAEETEPEIYRAIKHGAILENVPFFEGTRTPDYTSKEITQNTRVSYPIQHIPNIMTPSVAGHPTNLFFLACDSFGVLPPISKLTRGQAMFHFMSGYTAKIAGTEQGVNEPQTTFSACFGAPFLPLHPAQYAEMLGKKMEQHEVKVWLINTGWSGGAYGVGSRMKLRFTRAMIAAALTGALNNVLYQTDQVFGLHFPLECPNVPAEMLNPRNTWTDKSAYDAKAKQLAQAFIQNFAKFAPKASQEILDAAPKP